MVAFNQAVFTGHGQQQPDLIFICDRRGCELRRRLRRGLRCRLRRQLRRRRRCRLGVCSDVGSAAAIPLPSTGCASAGSAPKTTNINTAATTSSTSTPPRISALFSGRSFRPPPRPLWLHQQANFPPDAAIHTKRHTFLQRCPAMRAIHHNTSLFIQSPLRLIHDPYNLDNHMILPA